VSYTIKEKDYIPPTIPPTLICTHTNVHMHTFYMFPNEYIGIIHIEMN